MNIRTSPKDGLESQASAWCSKRTELLFLYYGIHGQQLSFQKYLQPNNEMTDQTN